ncbi:Tripartite tricarboxylate transporter TctA family protein [Gimesia panareensis]|uniref:Tripartite tricarboxylate transporter TctA family protein n=1 Tax=Gimesia panareensis TaxID=2527978 RepID=A0A517QC86_9PLAN|nr:tripartite tricarboxylate transporter substrate-binding protein [Gimesia panareensis]QDT29231.1 Tripartite tricarboxylate transporter TctA family protein [Gimesia panareensis]
MDALQTTVVQLSTPLSLTLIIVGTSLGIFVGAIPGLTGAMLIALTLPLTFTLDPQLAMTLLVSMYVGSISGGLITGTLLRMPGTPASVMTTLDGYPMSQKGQPGRALGLGIYASLVGGLISCVFLVALSAPIARWSTQLGPFEYFSLVLMALVLIATIDGASLTRSLFSGTLGILAAMPGISAATGEVRLTFGFTPLNAGFKLLPVLIGLFAINQVLRDIANLDQKIPRVSATHRGLLLTFADWKNQWVNMLRSSLIGTFIGILPGIGANIGSIAAYSAAKNSSQTPEQFGSGSAEGIIASEAANNATVGGALIPLVAMGIPGSVIDAILLGALVLHGLQPGPRLFSDHPELVHTIMGTYFLANLVMFAVMIASVGFLAKLVRFPRPYLLPIILTFCIAGAFALSNRMFDVWVMLGFGLLGLILERNRIPLAPFVIGFVLGPIAEENLSAGLMSSQGNWLPIITRPISLLFVVISALLLVVPLVRQFRKKRDSKQETLKDNTAEEASSIPSSETGNGNGEHASHSVWSRYGLPVWHTTAVLAIMGMIVFQYSGFFTSQQGRTQFPQRPIQAVVPFSAGGGTDLFARIIQKSITEDKLLKQPVVIINQPGGSSTIGSRNVKQARADGYKILCNHEGIITSKYSGKVNFGPEAFEPIAQTGEINLVVATHQNARYKNLSELLHDAEKHPGELQFGTNFGALAHFAAKKIEQASGGEYFNYVQAGDGQKRYTMLIGRHIDATIFSLAEFLSYQGDGKIRALAVLSEERQSSLPDVSTAREQQIDAVVGNSFYWWAPKGTPQERIDLLADTLEQAMQSDSVRNSLRALSIAPVFYRGEKLNEHISQSEKKFSELVSGSTVQLPDFPFYMIVATLLLMSLIVVQGIFLSQTPSSNSPSSSKPRIWLAVCCFVLLCCYVLVLEQGWLNYWLATALMIAVTGGAMAKWKPNYMLVLIELALLTGLGTEIVFTSVFSVVLP